MDDTKAAEVQSSGEILPLYIADMLNRVYLKDQQHKEITPYQIFQLEHEESVIAEIETVNFAEYLRVSEATQQQIKSHMQ